MTFVGQRQGKWPAPPGEMCPFKKGGLLRDQAQALLCLALEGDRNSSLHNEQAKTS